MTGAHALGFAIVLAVAGPAAGQTIISPSEQLAFDRPEAWALQYFTSATLMTALDVDAGAPGSVSLQLESGWLPALTAAQERVGFAGTAAEDLNKAPLFFRPRLRVDLPAGLALIAGGVPPIRAFGVTSRLIALGIEWTMRDTGTWRFVGRAHGQTGTVTGAFTCPPAVLTTQPGSAGNPTGCESVSSDVVTLRYGAVEVEAARRLGRLSNLEPHLSVTVNDIDSHFQVNAHTLGILDQTRLYTSGITWSMSAGASLPVGSRVALAADAFYSPLMVRRAAGGPHTIDGLFNVRGLVSYRLR